MNILYINIQMTIEANTYFHIYIFVSVYVYEGFCSYIYIYIYIVYVNLVCLMYKWRYCLYAYDIFLGRSGERYI